MWEANKVRPIPMGAKAVERCFSAASIRTANTNCVGDEMGRGSGGEEAYERSQEHLDKHCLRIVHTLPRGRSYHERTRQEAQQDCGGDDRTQ